MNGSLRRAGGVFFAALFSTITFPATASADIPGNHPYYLHAMHDLRYARYLLDKPDERNVYRAQQRAVLEIDQALGELRRAAIDDGKDLDDRERTDIGLTHRDRLQKALRLVAAADRDVTQHAENNAAAVPWRNRASGDIDDAYGFVRQAIATDRRDDMR